MSTNSSRIRCIFSRLDLETVNLQIRQIQDPEKLNPGCTSNTPRCFMQRRDFFKKKPRELCRLKKDKLFRLVNYVSTILIVGNVKTLFVQ